MRPTGGLSLRALSLVVLLAALLGAASVAAAQTPPRGPRAPLPAEQPVGMARLTGLPGGPLSFPVYGVAVGVERPTDVVAGAGAATGRARFADVALAKALDAATPQLWAAVAEGRRLSRVELALCPPAASCDFTAGGTPSPDAYLVYTLEDALITGLDDGGAPAGGALGEQVTFAYERLTVRAAGSPPVCWDRTAGRTC